MHMIMDRVIVISGITVMLVRIRPSSDLLRMIRMVM